MEAPTSAGESRRGRELGAGTALLAFLMYFTGQIVVTIVVIAFEMVRYAQGGGDLSDPAATETVMAGAVPALTLASMVGGFAGVGLAGFIVRGALKDRSRSGAAWVLGEPRAWLPSAVMGAALSSLVFLVAEVLPPPEEGGMLSQLAGQPGWGRAVWVMVAVLLAPPLEELLFRGLMLGGFHRRLGLRWAVVISTLVFVSVHVGEAIHYWPAFLFLIGLSLITCRQRIVHEAIGPAVAAHVGYNGVIAVSVLLSG